MSKKILLAALLAVTPAVAAPAAVDGQANIMEMLRSDLRADAQQITAVAMLLPDAEAERFWPIYREYEQQRASWSDRRLSAIKSYAEQFETMTDEASAELAHTWFQLQNERLEMYGAYYSSVESELGASVAARAIQVENQLMTLLDLQIAQQVPLIFNPPD
ncbi:MAG: hypothetical protein R3195_10490 [Gemmatimonadota bacterium]|nr:hypothetical protein [Gemmatimonadota bacterium]